MEKAHGGRGGQPNNNTGAMGKLGLGRDHKLVHPTMCVSFLATKGGSSISVAEAVGTVSSRDRKPLRSIRLEKRTEDCVMMH